MHAFAHSTWGAENPLWCEALTVTTKKKQYRAFAYELLSPYLLCFLLSLFVYNFCFLCHDLAARQPLVHHWGCHISSELALININTGNVTPEVLRHLQLCWLVPLQQIWHCQEVSDLSCMSCAHKSSYVGASQLELLWRSLNWDCCLNSKIHGF